MNATERERREEVRFMGQRSTPRSEQRRSAYGSLLMSMQTIHGRCPQPKCIKREGHADECWPT